MNKIRWNGHHGVAADGRQYNLIRGYQRHDGPYYTITVAASGGAFPNPIGSLYASPREARRAAQEHADQEKR